MLPSCAKVQPAQLLRFWLQAIGMCTLSVVISDDSVGIQHPKHALASAVQMLQPRVEMEHTCQGHLDIVAGLHRLCLVPCATVLMQTNLRCFTR